MTEIQKRIFLWKRVKALTTRYHNQNTGLGYTQMPGYQTASNYVFAAARYVERGKYSRQKYYRGLANLFRRMWITGNPHTDWL